MSSYASQTQIYCSFVVSRGIVSVPGSDYGLQTECSDTVLRTTSTPLTMAANCEVGHATPTHDVNSMQIRSQLAGGPLGNAEVKKDD